MKNRLIFLDRDGVINRDSPEYIKNADEWRPIPGSLEAIAELTKRGERTVIITNQSGVGRGLYSLDTLQSIHDKMLELIENHGGKIEKIYFCPHKPDENCPCRKPKTGMLEQARKDFDPDFSESYMIGDSLKDIQLGLQMGCKTILVKTGNGLKTFESHASELKQTIIAENLLDAIRNISL